MDYPSSFNYHHIDRSSKLLRKSALTKLAYIQNTGGSLHKIRTSLKYLCPSEHIPQKIEVDVSNLDIEDRVSIHDVTVHPSLKLLSKNESMPICKIKATTTENPETT